MSILLGVLAVLSASAAAGMRIALPLLIIGLLQGQLWYQVPLLSKINPQVVIAILTSWSLFELFASKKLLGQRVLQIIQLVFTPLVGAMMAVTVAKLLQLAFMPLWLIALVGALFSLVLRLVAIGWFFRLRGIPPWVAVIEDVLCVGLVFFAFNAPENGGLIAMLLLWIAVRSSTAWRRWFLDRRLGNPAQRQHPD
ncbi:MAG: hypothetical protein RLZZ490_2524 [Cyanobacteriota bacterium]|jgi:hypothetical protein